MPEKPHDDLLTSTAKTIGATAGKIATMAGLAEHPAAPAHAHSAKTAKLQKKNKTHLPRRMKKAQKKATTQADR
jgi:hypothetical protein